MRNLFLAAALILAPTLLLAMEQRNLSEPLGITLGAPASCPDFSARYKVGETDRTDDSRTLEVLDPSAAYPAAERVSAVCVGESVMALSITAEFVGTHTSAEDFLAAMEAEFETRSECPDLSEEPVRCAFFRAGSTVAVFTSAESEPEFYTLTYGFSARPSDTGEERVGPQPPG